MGTTDHSMLLHEGLRLIVQREAARRLAGPRSRPRSRWPVYFGNMNCTCARSCQLAPSSGCTTL
jgi:hypothetical protein